MRAVVEGVTSRPAGLNLMGVLEEQKWRKGARKGSWHSEPTHDPCVPNDGQVQTIFV